ncbi:hypothetical protein AVEN_39196-1 [Araneus ventricosus]|uniref:Uncharacterized protein n=1 Tax=Araneus ventricosus TaxID=182803 RepID=A0A4Y2QMU7_ARAVE|nr:hypothetical protein AVEN_39196-1 [Araneus ventricosus]
MPFALRPFPTTPPTQVEIQGTSFTEAPKCTTAAFRSPILLLPHTAGFRFSSLVEGFQSRQNYCFPPPSQRGPPKAIRSFQSDFKFSQGA